MLLVLKATNYLEMIIMKSLKVSDEVYYWIKQEQLRRIRMNMPTLRNATEHLILRGYDTINGNYSRNENNGRSEKAYRELLAKAAS